MNKDSSSSPEAEDSAQVGKVQDDLRAQIAQYPLLLYMKGSPQQPRCGFSARAVQALSVCGRPFAWVDILSEPQVRRHLPAVSEWPTFPQLFIAGELIGGSDIIHEMYESGELRELISQLPDEAEAASS